MIYNEQHFSLKNSGETLFTKAFQAASYFIYEICELRRLIGSRNTLVSYSPKLSYAELTLIMKFTSDSSRLSDSKSQNPSLLCQKDQAAKFCLNFGTEPYIELILYTVSFLTQILV
ncbi:hypothetical protein CLV95_104153 [Leptospira borgpetersenii serovar Javanica]|nr:hypothetical protein CLV95_104153 [Leptospira borgpetersenii serovar Javanica]